MHLKRKLLNGLLLSGLFIFLSPTITLACTYQATITGTHLHFAISSDLDKLAVVQYKLVGGGTQRITNLTSPEIGIPWNYYTDYSTPNCGTFNGNGALMCNQQGGTGAYWSYEQPSGVYHLLPGGIYGIDFNSAPTYESLGIEYGVIPGTTGEGWTFCSRTGDVPTPSPSPTPSPTSTPTESPTPSPSPSPTPTHSPTPTPTQSPTPLPISKVFLAPGMGASWNPDALLNCKASGYNGSWTLAPYAKNIYNPLLSALTSDGWDTKSFYYDWRKDIRDSSSPLTAFINSNSEINEKVDIVGHSMGGLVGRAYLEAQSGGKASKLLAAGSPNQGSALAYPVFSGNEVWATDLIERIATNLLLNRCGVPQSIQNLLPTYDYLRNAFTGQLKSISSISAKNNWLPTNFSAPFWGVKVGTLAGTGFPTLKIIDVENPNKKDLRDGLWIDGKPVGKEKANEGDGTVLLQSAQLTGAYSNEVINQTHSGIIASTEGINNILGFLGSPGIDDPPYTEPSSALVIIGYPGNFWIKDSNGNIFQSEDGIVTIFDPKSGNYDLQVIPQSNDTLLIVEQLLPNNKNLYKEYRLKGVSPKTKILNFDSKHPSEDILKEPKHKNDPRRQIFWDSFWKFLNKHYK